MYIVTSGLNPSEDHICHYGVKGMKWGVRHVKPVNHKQRLFGRAIDWEDELTVDPGTKLYRITPHSKEKSNYRYVTVDENDRNYYKSEWSKTVRSGEIGKGKSNKPNEVYENEYEVKTKLKMPSAKKRQEIAYRIGKSDKYKELDARLSLEEWVEDANQSQNMTSKQAREYVDKMQKKNPEQYSKYINDLKAQLSNAYSNQPPEWLASRVLSNTGGSDEIRSMFLDEVKKAGYNATVDDYGAAFKGSKNRVNTPLILIDPDSTTSQTKSTKISVEDAEAAGKQYVNDIMSISSSKSKKYFVPNVMKDYNNEDNYHSDRTYAKNYAKVHKLGKDFVDSL